jgi:hypothetical protein
MRVELVLKTIAVNQQQIHSRFCCTLMCVKRTTTTDLANVIWLQCVALASDPADNSSGRQTKQRDEWQQNSTLADLQTAARQGQFPQKGLQTVRSRLLPAFVI